jgi:hypothetical protein
MLADNLKRIDQRLFLRLAEMSDSETDEYEKLRIRQLATLVASTLETILEQADRQMSADAETVQGLLRSLALESGEFELPCVRGPREQETSRARACAPRAAHQRTLSSSRVARRGCSRRVPAAQLAACRAAVREQLPTLDEGFVGTVKAYMRKASDDGLESMVDVLRVLLQTYAAERLRALADGKIGASEGVQTAIRAALDVSSPHRRTAPPHRTAAPPHRRTAAPPHRRTAAPPHRRTAAPPHRRTAARVMRRRRAARGRTASAVATDVSCRALLTSCVRACGRRRPSGGRL